MKMVPCDICGKEMSVLPRDENCPFPDRRGFECACGQQWTSEFGEDDWHCTILKTFWPFQMSDAIVRDQYLPAWIARRERRAALNSAIGIWDEQRVKTYLNEGRDEVSKWHTEHPIQLGLIARIRALVCK